MFFQKNFYRNINTRLNRLFNFVPLFAVMVLSGCANPDPSTFSSANAKLILEGRVASTGGLCSLDSVAKKGIIDGAYRIKNASGALFSGWAWDKEQNTPSDYVVVRLIDIATGEMSYSYTSSRGLRSDVATFLQIPPDSKVAFELDAKNLPAKAGSYNVELLQVWPNVIKECKVPATLILE